MLRLTTPRGGSIRSSRASSDFAESPGISVATLRSGSIRDSRRALCEVCFITLAKPPCDAMGAAQIRAGEHQQQRAVVAQRAEIHPPHQPAGDQRGVDAHALVLALEGEADHREPAAARLGLVHRRGEIAIERGRGQQPGARIEQPAGVERFQGAVEPRFERVLPEQRQGVDDRALRLARRRFPDWADRTPATRRAR